MLSWMVSELPELGRQVEKVMETSQTSGSVQRRRTALLTLEETWTPECQEKQLQHERFGMTMYQEKRHGTRSLRSTSATSMIEE